MPRPYNLKTRKDAVDICTILASNAPMSFAETVNALGIKPSSTGPQLAGHAYNAVSKFIPGQQWPAVWSEAAELIRSGWRLDEPLERIPQPKVVLACAGLPVEEETIVAPEVGWEPCRTTDSSTRPDAGDPERMRRNDERGMEAYNNTPIRVGAAGHVEMMTPLEMQKRIADEAASYGPSILANLIETETAAAHASMDAKEAELYTHGYGGEPTEPSPEGEPGDYGSDS